MKLVPLGSVADIQLGKMLSPRAKNSANPSPYLRNKNVQWGRIDTSDLATMHFSDREKEKFQLVEGDLLVCEGGEPGRCAIWKNEHPQCFFQKALHRIRPRRHEADSEFLSFWIRYQAITGAFEDQNAQTTIAHLPLVRLEQLMVPQMPVHRQRMIADHLRSQLAAADLAADAARLRLRDVTALQSSLYRHAFTGIVPVAIAPPIGLHPPGWRWAYLRDVARLESGHTPSRSRGDWWGGEISWISLTEIRKLDGRWTEHTELTTNEAGIANSAARILPKGTVCFSRTASVGFVTIMGKPMATSQDFANWVCGPDLAPDFLMHALICARSELRALATGATHKTIYMPALESFQVCLPSRSAQDRVVELLQRQLKHVDTIRGAARSLLVDAESLTARLLAVQFEG